MKTKDVMNTKYIVIEKDARIKEAISRMARYNTTRLIVVRRRGDTKPYGILTEYDIFYRLSRSKMRRIEPYNTSVASAATTPVDTVEEDFVVGYVAKNMLHKGYSSMPVVNNNNDIVGLISKKDVIKLLYRYEEYLKLNISAVTTKIRGRIRLFDRLTLALSKFMGTGFSNLVVIDDKKPVGILRAYDVAKILFTIRKVNPTPHWENAVKEVYVADVIRRDIAILNIDATLGDALNIIVDRGQNIIPVVDDGEERGLVSRSTILKFMLNKKII